MSSLLSSLFIFLIIAMLDLSDFLIPSNRTGALSFKDHLPRTRPTKNIFNLLESLRSESLLRRYPAELAFDMLKVIIKWLEVSFRECNRQLETPQTNNPICSRDLVQRDKATCTIASRVNFFKFISNKNLRLVHRLVNCSSVPLQVVCKNTSFDFEQSF